MLRDALQRGRQAALARFKLAAQPQQPTPLTAAQTAAAAMPPVEPKTPSPTTPIAAHARKSNIIG